MLSLLKTYDTDYTATDLATIVAQQLADCDYGTSDSLRTAVLYSPLTMTAAEFVVACQANGVRANTARNRYSEVRRQQRADGELS